MDHKVRNFLYRNPSLYELVYPEPNDETPSMIRRMFSRFLSQPPRSILDLGCGTGRDLDSLSRDGAECCGVDCLPEMIEFARSVRPYLRLEVGDMLSVRLGRTFDAILCMGSALMYALTNRELSEAFETFAAHSHPGTLLVLDINNAASYLGPGGIEPSVEFQVSRPEFTAKARVTYRFDRPRQILIRERTWVLDTGEEVKDFCEYRLLFPQELAHLLDEHGFVLKGIFDNMELRESDLSGPRLYVAATSGNGSY